MNVGHLGKRYMRICDSDENGSEKRDLTQGWRLR